MPQFIPPIDPNVDMNQGEFIMAELMERQLPDRILIYHHLEWVMEGPGGDTLFNGETDFLLIDPLHGILIVEVKTGNYACDPETSQWFRVVSGGRREPMSLSPFDQALRSRNNLIKRLQNTPQFARNIPFHYAHAVAFPVNDYDGDLPMNTHPDLLWNSDDCHLRLADRVQRCFELSALPDPHPMTPEQVAAVQRIIHPQFRVISTLRNRIRADEQVFHRLTRDQSRLLDFLSHHRRALIRGVAGSGKTLLAVQKARMLAQEGVRTLLLCYNTGLRDWIRTQLDDLPPELLLVENYHGLAIRYADDPRVRPDDTTWMDDATVQEIVESALHSLPEDQRFEALIVDEGQDIPDLWWITLEEAFRADARGESGIWYIFHDPDQAIRDVPAGLPKLGPPFHLSKNCRNTTRILDVCRTLVQTPLEAMDGAPAGTDPTQARVSSAHAAAADISRTVSRWLRPAEGALHRSQIAILTRRHYVDELLRQLAERNTAFTLTQSLAQWRQGKGVLITTPNSFKGLEADAVVTVDPPPPDDMPAAYRYICWTRARHLLHTIEVRG